jgi:hypothetical protein
MATKSTKSRPMVRIHDISTGEIIDRELNDEEFAEYQANQNKLSIEQAEIETKKSARDAVLAKLGLTADEVAALLG